MHLTLSLIVVAGALWAFAALIDAVLDNATMVRWDLAVAAQIHRRESPLGLRFFTAITQAGSPVSMTIVSVVACIILLARRRPTLFVTWIAAVGGGSALERLTKSLVHRTRPIYAGATLLKSSFSFPSGHAMISTLCMGMLVYALTITRDVRGRARVALVAVASVFVLGVGISRVYLDVHYPSDVVGGFVGGAAWLGFCIALAGVVLHQRGITLQQRSPHRGDTSPAKSSR